MRPGAWKPACVVLLLSILLILTGMEAVLLELKRGLFTGGFLTNQLINTPGRILGYFLSSLILDAFLVLGLWGIVAPVARALRASHLQTIFLFLAVSLGGPLAVDFIKFQIHVYLGDLINFRVLWDLSGGNPAEMLAHAAGHVGILLACLAAAGVTAVVFFRLARRLETGNVLTPPRARSLILLSLLCGIVSTGIAIGLTRADSPVRMGLATKPSWDVLTGIVEVVSDLDRDGYGILSLPPDPAMLDGKIHPYAHDIPGNGIDENGVGGDHPVDFDSKTTSADHAGTWPRKPHVLLILLETFRADLLEWVVHERPVTPFLQSLAEEGACSLQTYSHGGYTVPSRAQLFGGRVHYYAGQSTLLDDFRRNGYRIGYFSGQDESFGDSEPFLGYSRADAFYDARQDKDKRYSLFTTPGSLAVSWKLLNSRALSFLKEQDPSVPLFMYVNYHDTHFPYHHRELDNILGIEPLGRADIRPVNREALKRTYANAAANVDQGIRQMVEAWRRHFHGREQIIIVTADHGESLFDDGLLGHGTSVSREQLQVPFIVWGPAGDWPRPMGHADIRPVLQRNLSKGVEEVGARPRIVNDPGRYVFQYVGGFRHPRILAWRGLDDEIVYDFWTRQLRQASVASPGGKRVDAALFQSMIWTWEALTAPPGSIP